MKDRENWYAVYTRVNTERTTLKELGKRSITAFLPTKWVTRQWSDRRKQLEVPLFPNYIFVKVAPKEFWTVLMANGVVKFVSFEGEPAVVKENEIEVVRLIASNHYSVSNEGCPVEGEKVKVNCGPLAGLEGKVLYKNGATRLCIELEAIHQYVSINIDARLLDKCC